MSLDQIKPLALALSAEERMRLMDELSESLVADHAPMDLTDEQRVELERRLAEADAHPESLVPLDEVQRRLAKYT